MTKKDNRKIRASVPYSCALPSNLGWFRRLFLKLIFNSIRVDSVQFKVIENLPDQALVVYVSKYKSKFECLFFYFQCSRNGAPIPRIAFDYRFYFWQPFGRILEMAHSKIFSIKAREVLPDAYESGFAEDRLLNGGAGYLSLLGRSGFSARWTGSARDPLEYLLSLQRDIEQPIYLIPQLIFFSKKPHKDQQGLSDFLPGSKEKPGFFKRMMTLLKKPEDIILEISEPFELKSFLEKKTLQGFKYEAIAADLRRKLLDQINGHRQRITGPILKNGEELRQAVLTSPQLTRYIRRHAARKNITLTQARKEAAKHFDEIAAKYNPRFVAFGANMMRWLLCNLFDATNVDLEGLNRVKRKHLKGPLIFIPCHKSNFDNITLMSVLHANHVHCPHTFAGKNLSFWPVGPFIRRTGAFFMRRSFKGAVFYAMVFSEYIKRLLEEGYNMEVFIEGTRSRSGKLLPPQAGALSILINACQTGTCPDLVFVPVSIGYDRIPEESSYLHEIQGGQKTKEGLWMLLKAIKSGKLFKRRYGQLYFRFAEPIALSALLEQEQRSITELLKGKELHQFSQRIGNRLLFDVQRVSVVTPQAVVAAALLSTYRENIATDQLIEIVETYLAYLAHKNTFMTDALVMDPTGTIMNVLDFYTRQGIIEPIKSMGFRAQYKIPENKRNHLEFYKNNAIGHLVPAAFTAMLILATDMFQFGAYHLQPNNDFLQKLFANEFFFDPDHSPVHQLRKTIKAFINDAILVPHQTLPDTYNLTSPGFRKLQFFSGLLKSLFEAYRIALSYYASLPKKFPTKKERVKSMRSMAQYMLKKKQIDRVESISEAYFGQADAMFSQLGFQKPDSSETRENYLKQIQHLLKYLP